MQQSTNQEHGSSIVSWRRALASGIGDVGIFLDVLENHGNFIVG
jgi:hypothetical protein